MASPPYVRRGGLDASPPPWQCDDLEGTIFYVKADAAALQGVCKRTLNAPSGGRLDYQPLVSWVALTFQSFKGLHSISPASPLRETHTYMEAAFWIMVRDARADRGGELLIPYMFIDDWVALAAGREIFGYPKEYASLTIPPIASPPLRFAVKGLAVAAPGAAAATAPILECVARNAAFVSDPTLVGDYWPQAALLSAEGGTLSRMWTLIQMLLAQRLDFVFLRQMRPLAGGSGSDLQQVTAASARPFVIDDVPRILFDYELRLPPLASHPIAADLGLTAGGIVDVPIGLQCTAHFTLQPGVVL